MNVGFKLLSSTVEPLTPDLAKSFAEMKPSPVERDFDERRVDYLRGKVEEGLFLPPHWTSVDYGGDTLRINGQHSSKMLIGLDGKFPDGLQVHIDRFTAESPEDMVMLFRQIDNRRSARSPADMAGAYQGNVAALKDVPKNVAKRVAEAVTWYRLSVEAIPTTPREDDRYAVMQDPTLHPFFTWAAEIYNSKTKELEPIPVCAALFATFHANEREARHFWDEVARAGDPLNDAAPSTVLDVWLREPREIKGLNRPKGEQYNGCIYAWNMFRHGRDIRDIKSSTHKGFHAPAE
jgi:hypothetical protein